jgi:archaellum biogenesis ATPase FlaH
MSAGAEKSLFGLLREVESVEKLALEGFSSEFIPTIELRPVYDWALYQYRQSGREIAPTVEMFRHTEVVGQPGKSIASLLEEHSIFMDDTPEESVEWVIDELRGRHLTRMAGQMFREASEELVGSSTADRPDVFKQHVSKLVGLALDIQSGRGVSELRENAGDIISDYERRKALGQDFIGMKFGLDQIDAHIGGVHEGELGIIAAPPKGSKSFMIDRIALKEFEAGRNVVLFTLENSIEMTRNRIACLATGVHPRRFEEGQCNEDEELAIQAWVDTLEDGDNTLFILQPDQGSRRIDQMVLEAQIRLADTLLIDQLTFVEPENPKDARYLQVRQIMHTLKTLISTGHQKMSCIMTHQLNREGIKAARKNGYLYMEDFAEGSEVERTVDWAIGMWQSEDDREVGQFLFQILAARRRDFKAWKVAWDISTGTMEVLFEEHVG